MTFHKEIDQSFSGGVSPLGGGKKDSIAFLLGFWPIDLTLEQFLFEIYVET